MGFLPCTNASSIGLRAAALIGLSNQVVALTLNTDETTLDPVAGLGTDLGPPHPPAVTSCSLWVMR